MRKIRFTKMVASGNDFIVLEFLSSRVRGLRRLAQEMCNRKYGIGADGLLVLEKSRKADIRMRIFNADGSEAKMCGNGARCVGRFVNSLLATRYSLLKIETKAGIIESQVKGKNVKIKLTEPKDIKLNIPIKINNRLLKVNFIDTGVPHTVIFVEGLDKIDVVDLGRQIRYHKKFVPRGTNVDFVEVLNNSSIKIRTYERGVEDETLACGTGVVAAALVFSYPMPAGRQELSVVSYKKINVHTKSKEILKVYFDKINDEFRDVWLEGKAKIICKGEYYVK